MPTCPVKRAQRLAWDHVPISTLRVGRVDLLPGDVLELCNLRFLVGWVGPGGELLPSEEAPDTACIGGTSSNNKEPFLAQAGPSLLYFLLLFSPRARLPPTHTREHPSDPPPVHTR